MNSGSPAIIHPLTQKRIAILAATALLLVLFAVPAAHDTSAAPSLPGSVTGQPVAQNVDYIGASAAARLSLNIPVLVPGWVPAPFSGAPSIDAGGGYYSLYWMNAGGEPTFLQVSGVAGGRLPVASPYDLNIELSVNASVNGNSAVHDVTPIYDSVWWVQGGVLYSVQSRNMTGADSLGLASSLVTFVPPAAPTPTPAPAAPVAPTPAPSVPTPTTVPVGTDSTTSEPASVEPTSEPTAEGEGGDEATGEPETDAAGDPLPTPTATTLGSDGTGDVGYSSDGTGGPPVEVVATDGTGGATIIVIPRRAPILQPMP